MLQVKGTVAVNIRNYIKKEHADNYKSWLNNLPPNSRNIFTNSINASEWLSVEDAAISPTQKIADLYFNKDVKKAAWALGRYNAEESLRGIYKVFVLMATPKFMIDRASKIMTTFYNPSQMEVVASRPKGVTLQIIRLDDANPVIEYRIGGWIERALEICGCKGLVVKITKAISSGDAQTEYTIDWE